MTAVASAVIGYLVGGVPTADWISAGGGIDLRGSGSHNPGANNAWRLSGPLLAAGVLATEMLKGIAIVVVGSFLGGQAGVVAAAIGGVTGNVLNPYRRFSGGQGLGITAGLLLASSPLMAVSAIGVIGVVAWRTRSSAVAALAAVGTLVVAAVVLPVGPWGLTHWTHRVVLAVGLGAVISPKQVRRIRRRDPGGFRSAR